MQRKDDLAGIQYIRGFAAAIVVLFHTSAMGAESKYFGYTPFGGRLVFGGTGVDLFFVLSGFIIAFIALGPDLKPKIAARPFLERRAIRILPFLWFAVLAYAGLKLVGRGAFDLLPYARAFMPLWPVGELAPNVVWTLRHELWFYALFAAVVLLGRLPWWTLALWFISPLALSGFAPAGDLTAFVFSPVDLLFGFGMAVGSMFLVWRPKLPRISALWLAAALAGFAAVAIALDYQTRDIPHVLALAPIAALCIAVGALSRPASGWVGRLAHFLGDASYSVYLTHSMFISAVLGVISHRMNGAPPALWIGAITFGAIVWGCALHWLVEKRLLSLGRRLLARPAPAAAPTRLAA